MKADAGMFAVGLLNKRISHHRPIMSETLVSDAEGFHRHYVNRERQARRLGVIVDAGKPQMINMRSGMM